jgi:hypothetical protein
MMNRKLMAKRFGFFAIVSLLAVVSVPAFIFVAGVTFIGLYVRRELRTDELSPLQPHV